jgi:hypothetical protein
MSATRCWPDGCGRRLLRDAATAEAAAIDIWFIVLLRAGSRRAVAGNRSPATGNPTPAPRGQRPEHRGVSGPTAQITCVPAGGGPTGAQEIQ